MKSPLRYVRRACTLRLDVVVAATEPYVVLFHDIGDVWLCPSVRRYDGCSRIALTASERALLTEAVELRDMFTFESLT